MADRGSSAPASAGRICLIAPALPSRGPNRGRHGTATYTEMCARAWLLAGAEVHVVHYATDDAFSDAPPVAPVTLHRVPVPAEGRIPGLAMLRSAWRILRTVRRLDATKRFDVIEGINDEGHCLLLALAFGTRFHLRVLTSLEQSIRYRGVSPTLEERVSGVLSALTVRRSAHLITSSVAQVGAMKAVLKNREIAVIPLGIVDPGQVEFRRSATASLHIGYVGMLSLRKGIDILLRALQHHSETGASSVTATIIGADRGGAPQGSWAEWAREELGLSELTVGFRGALSDDELAEVWRTLDVLVVPSRWESFGLVVPEAMARGVVVVASASGALPEVVGDAGLLFKLEDAEELAATLARLADNPTLRMELGRVGRRRFEANYSIAAFAARLVAHHGLGEGRHRQRRDG